tara:strand:- start:251 stop:415 length:165 start_codon:yes stop_codon:yes gene_type:complete
MKKNLLSGNYEPKVNPEVDTSETKDENEFEKEAVKKLGGSIAFVRGDKFYEENN